MGMTSDIGKWGFNLFQKKNPTNVESEVITSEPAPESQQEESKPLEKSDSTDEAPAPAEVKENAPPSEIIDETSIDSTTSESNGEVVVSAVEVEVSPPAPESPQIHEENIESAPSAPSTTTSCSDTVPSEDALSIPEAETTAPIEQEIPEEPKNEKLETAPTPAATTVYEGDLGQGSLEDKELYTTRE
jgi:hypothetical protein